MRKASCNDEQASVFSSAIKKLGRKGVKDEEELPERPSLMKMRSRSFDNGSETKKTVRAA